MAQVQPRRFRETSRLERALSLVRVPNDGRYTERGLQQCLRLRVVGIIFIAMWRKRAKHQVRSQPLCEMCLKEGTSMLQRSQTTSSHIKVINKNSSSAELQSLCKLHHESRQETRGSARLLDCDRRRRLASRPKASRIFEGAGGA